MSVEYSRGYSATVEYISPNSPFANIADLVRTETTRDLRWFERLFIRHKIAYALFPDHFIQVVACGNAPSSPTIDIGTTFRTLLYSKLAPVPAEHAIFSAHYAEITKVALGSYLDPEITPKCQCDICRDHTQFHAKQKLKFQAQNLDWQYFRQYGITTPTDDPTDYCLAPTGLVFFEIERFLPDKLRYFLGATCQNPQKPYLDWLLDKFKSSQNISRTKSPTGAINFS